MKPRLPFPRNYFGPLTGCLLLTASLCLAGQYTNFDVAIYIPVNVVQSFADPNDRAFIANSPVMPFIWTDTDTINARRRVFTASSSASHCLEIPNYENKTNC